MSYWNTYVAVTQMHGQGNFSDPRLGINVTANPDLVTSKLPALAEYQLSLWHPPGVQRRFGRQLYAGRRCSPGRVAAPAVTCRASTLPM